MATIKFGAIVTDMRGKLGGHVFQKGNQSRVMKTNVKSRKTLSSFNQATQLRVNDVIGRYNALSYANKLAWSNAAKEYNFKNRFGDTVQYTGRQLFLYLNNNLLSANLSVITTPTNLNPVVPIPSFSSCSFNTAGSTGTCAGATAPAGSRYVFKMQQIAPGAITPNFDKAIFCANTSTTAFTAPIIYNPYVLRYGVPLTTTNAFVWAYLVNSSGFPSYSILRKVTIT